MEVNPLKLGAWFEMQSNGYINWLRNHPSVGVYCQLTLTATLELSQTGKITPRKDTRMRPQHTGHVLEGFPVYSSGFTSPSRLVLGGGGGQVRSGVKNKLASASLFRNNGLLLLCYHAF
jgi:hypothetical protein